MVSSGGNKDFVFGKNELGLHRLHDWIDYYVNARAERPLDASATVGQVQKRPDPR